jgi:hypothetical protein
MSGANFQLGIHDLPPVMNLLGAVLQPRTRPASASVNRSSIMAPPANFAHCIGNYPSRFNPPLKVAAIDLNETA